MATYIALLRAVNVGGNPLKMARLLELWSELGFRSARTYAQSGNIVFEARGAPPAWSAAIEKKLAGEARLPVTVILRSAADWSRIVAANPFLKQKGVDLSKLHVTFLESTPTKDALARLSEAETGGDEFRVSKRELYLCCPNGYGKSKLANNRLERLLGTKATTRNWNTVNRLHAMSREPA